MIIVWLIKRFFTLHEIHVIQKYVYPREVYSNSLALKSQKERIVSQPPFFRGYGWFPRNPGTTWHVWNHVNMYIYTGISTMSTGEFAGFLNHQQYVDFWGCNDQIPRHPGDLTSLRWTVRPDHIFVCDKPTKNPSQVGGCLGNRYICIYWNMYI